MQDEEDGRTGVGPEERSRGDIKVRLFIGFRLREADYPHLEFCVHVYMSTNLLTTIAQHIDVRRGKKRTNQSKSNT